MSAARLVGVAHRNFTRVFFAQVELLIVDLVENLEPFVDRFHIDRAHIGALTNQIGDQMPADKSAAAANNNFSHEIFEGA